MRKALPRLRLYSIVRFLRIAKIYAYIQKRSVNLAVSRAFYCVVIKCYIFYSSLACFEDVHKVYCTKISIPTNTIAKAKYGLSNKNKRRINPAGAR